MTGLPLSESGNDNRPVPVAVWRCPRCGYDKVEYEGDDPSKSDRLTSWLCEDVCRGPAYSINPAEERQLERIPVVPASELVNIGRALIAEDLDHDSARINRARGIIMGLSKSKDF